MTPEGTKYFESLDDEGRKDFYMKLRQELADAIPVSFNRITTNENNEIDTSIPSKQILLSINIEKDETKQERSVGLAINDLDHLIKHQSITVISFGESSNYLDKEYGYKPFRKISFINYENSF